VIRQEFDLCFQDLETTGELGIIHRPKLQRADRSPRRSWRAPGSSKGDVRGRVRPIST
jgi:hypothetical protein